jgi:deoxyribodipyrimidine photo-lyase
MTPQLVWFKRDLRTFDHEALFRAAQSGPVLCFYVLESEYWQLNNTSNRQWLFIRESLIDLHAQLERLGINLIFFQGDVISFLEKIRQSYGSFTLHIHLETGIDWTYQRDKNVAKWCKNNQCKWLEYAQNGVCRPVRSRKISYKEHWAKWVNEPLFSIPKNIQQIAFTEGLLLEDLPMDVCTDEYPCPGRQFGGRKEGLKVLESFLHERAESYSGSISSPITAESACSRLSPHIAYGCLSFREIVQRTTERQEYAPSRQWAKSLAAFSRRLSWHCSFIQSFESQSDMQTLPIMAKMAQLDRPFDQVKFEAWASGNTGRPLVDACMRYLHHHGWINFRMRAMLISIATHPLSLPWQDVADFLAKQFVDFEPGIHYPQIQMQSGMMGQTVLRIYNPVSQAIDLDPNGHFVRKWVPELRQVSQTWIYEPLKMTPNLQEQAGWTKDYFYPQPLVEFNRVHQEVKAAVTEIRSHQKPSKSIKLKKQDAGATNANKAERRKAKVDAAQISLF